MSLITTITYINIYIPSFVVTQYPCYKRSSQPNIYTLQQKRDNYSTAMSKKRQTSIVSLTQQPNVSHLCIAKKYLTGQMRMIESHWVTEVSIE